MRWRFCANSAASAPPACALIEISASRESYSPDSRVRISSWSISLRSAQVAGRFLARGLVVLAVGQLEHHPGVVQPLMQLAEPAQLTLQVGEPPGDRLRPLLVTPETGIGGLFLEVVRLAPHRVRVQDGFHVA